MSRVHDFSCKQSSLESNDGLGPTIKYTSQPQLNGSPADYIGNNNRQYYNPGNDALTPLSLKTSITFPRQPGIGQTATSHGLQKPPKPPERKPLCSLTRQDNVRSSYDSSSNNYPDLVQKSSQSVLNTYTFLDMLWSGFNNAIQCPVFE